MSSETIRLVRMFVKHVLHFTGGTSYSFSPTLSPFSSPILSVTDSLRRYISTVLCFFCDPQLAEPF